MEGRLMLGFDVGGVLCPQHYLAEACHGSGLPEGTVSVAAELIVLCAREYELLRLHPRLLVACVLYVAVRNSPDEGVEWTCTLARQCGYETSVIACHVSTHLSFLEGETVNCRRIGSQNRARTLLATVWIPPSAEVL